LLWDGGLILRDEPMEKGQAERLMPLLEEVLAEAGIGWRDLSGWPSAPGRATSPASASPSPRRGGWRLGLGIPAVGVTRLEALAYGLPRPVTVVEDARRGEVYVQEFLPEGPEAARLSGIADHLLYGPGNALVGAAAAEVTRQWGGVTASRAIPWPKPSPGSVPNAHSPPAPPGPLLPARCRCRPAADPPPVILP
jgi:tRNA threonylcarbamoyladenosine biosynthesis protein TsaB